MRLWKDSTCTLPFNCLLDRIVNCQLCKIVLESPWISISFHNTIENNPGIFNRATLANWHSIMWGEVGVGPQEIASVRDGSLADDWGWRIVSTKLAQWFWRTRFCRTISLEDPIVSQQVLSLKRHSLLSVREGKMSLLKWCLQCEVLHDLYF